MSPAHNKVALTLLQIRESNNSWGGGGFNPPPPPKCNIGLIVIGIRIVDLYRFGRHLIAHLYFIEYDKYYSY